MADTPTIEPVTITAGDTVQWRREDLTADYPAPTWTLSYYIRGECQPTTVTATADGTMFAVTITAAVTATWNPGQYWMAGKVSSGSEVHTVYEGRMTVKRNLALADARYDGRTFARKLLDIIEAKLAGSDAPDIESYTIGDRAVGLMKRSELWALRRKLRAEVAAEERAERIARGETPATHVLTEF